MLDWGCMDIGATTFGAILRGEGVTMLGGGGGLVNIPG